MSRSRRKAPFYPVTTADSDKRYKQQESRKQRRAANTVLSQSLDGDTLPSPKEYGDPWRGDKDGMMQIDSDSKFMRK